MGLGAAPREMTAVMAAPMAPSPSDAEGGRRPRSPRRPAPAWPAWLDERVAAAAGAALLALLLLARLVRWRAHAGPAWAADPDPRLAARIGALPCDLPRLDAAELQAAGLRVADLPRPVLVTSPIGGCGARCAEHWDRERFLRSFGHLPVALSSQLGVAVFGPNADGAHLHGWPVSLAHAVAQAEAATRAALDAEATRDEAVAFDASASLAWQLLRGTSGWEGAEDGWPEWLADFGAGRPIFSLAASRTGLPFHRHGAAFLWLVHGLKHWLFLPPGAVPDAVPQLGNGTSVWRWVSGQGGVRMPSPTGSLSGLLQCTQRPGEVIVVPRRWHHATLSIGTALGFGGEEPAPGRRRALADIERDLASSPKSVDLIVEKAEAAPNARVKMRTLRVAQKLEPLNYEVWRRLLELLAAEGVLKALAAQVEQFWAQLEALERDGTLSAQQVSVVLGQLMATVLEQPPTQKDPHALLLCVDFLERAVGRDGANDHALFYLAVSLMLSGQRAEAEQRLLHCLELKPGHQKALDTLSVLRGGRPLEL